MLRFCRYDRRKEREREWRLEELERKGVKKSKITRDKDRDISERIALGLAAPTVAPPTHSADNKL
jgi:SNW domain-containing protein 1